MEKHPEVPASFSDLISRIRLTEFRLQEAITSLDDATHRFKQEIPKSVVDKAQDARCDQQLCVMPSHQNLSAPEFSPEQPLRKGFMPEDEDTNVASPLRSLEWTQLNPLYPASSHSASPEPQTSRPNSRSISPVPTASRSTGLHRVVPGPQRGLGSVLDGDENLQAVQMQHGSVEQIDGGSPSRGGHGDPSRILYWPDMCKADMVAQRQSAIDSVVSVSSAWSLEQSSKDERHLLNHPIMVAAVNNGGDVAPNVRHDGIRTLYSASQKVGDSEGGHSRNVNPAQGHNSARPMAASAGHAHLGSHHRQEDSGDEWPLLASASLPGWNTAEPGVHLELGGWPIVMVRSLSFSCCRCYSLAGREKFT